MAKDTQHIRITNGAWIIFFFYAFWIGYVHCNSHNFNFNFKSKIHKQTHKNSGLHQLPSNSFNKSQLNWMIHLLFQSHGTIIRFQHIFFSRWTLLRFFAMSQSKVLSTTTTVDEENEKHNKIDKYFSLKFAIFTQNITLSLKGYQSGAFSITLLI